MKTLCPYTIGKVSPCTCDHGVVNGMRCPYWQQDGQYTYVENLMDNPIVMESALCKYIPEIIRDFEVVGNYRWYCTQWPGIREKGFVCMLQDGLGNKYTVNEVISRYAKDENDDEMIKGVMVDDGGREEAHDTQYTTAYN